MVKLAESETETVIGIAGRYIKDTTIECEQVFEQGQGLLKTPGYLRSALSAVFVLVPNNHRLIYVNETKDAPSKESFRSTLLKFLRQKHDEYIDQLYAEKKEARASDSTTLRTTKKELREEFPQPTLELIPLTTEDSIEAFVRKYDVLKSIEISLSDRNDENDNDPFFEQLQERKDAIRSVKAVLKHGNSQGLNQVEAIREIAEATIQGNQSVLRSGTDRDGDLLKENNEKFQLRKPIDHLSRDTRKAAGELYDTLQSIVSDGLISIPDTSRRAVDVVNSLISRLF